MIARRASCALPPSCGPTAVVRPGRSAAANPGGFGLGGRSRTPDSYEHAPPALAPGPGPGPGPGHGPGPGAGPGTNPGGFGHGGRSRTPDAYEHARPAQAPARPA